MGNSHGARGNSHGGVGHELTGQGTTERPGNSTWPVDGPVERIPIAALRAAQSPRVSGENLDHVRALAETEGKLPPIIVHRPTMRVIDGMHRVRAAEQCDQEEIEVRFFDGDETEAFILSVRANIAHGLPLSLADRKAAALRIVAEHPHWSDRMIAARTGLAAKTIGAISGRSGDRPNARIGQDGRVRPVSSSTGRQLAGELLADNPGLSLRQVARAAGISPETVRDVRRRLHRGEDPVSSRQRVNGSRIADKPAEAATNDAAADELPSVVNQLGADPAIRFNSAGRTLLKILTANTVINDRFDSIAENVPEHCRDAVAKAAWECAEVWQSFASELDGRE